jgi:hypothetical protein
MRRRSPDFARRHRSSLQRLGFTGIAIVIALVIRGATSQAGNR